MGAIKKGRGTLRLYVVRWTRPKLWKGLVYVYARVLPNKLDDGSGVPRGLVPRVHQCETDSEVLALYISLAADQRSLH